MYMHMTVRVYICIDIHIHAHIHIMGFGTYFLDQQVLSGTWDPLGFRQNDAFTGTVDPGPKKH